MSGGLFDYKDETLCQEIFDWDLSSTYGIGSEEQIQSAKIARRINPFEDAMISELVYDVFCLIYSFDYYVSGDTGEDTYRADVNAFKDKWLKMSAKKLAERTIINNIKDLEERLRRELMLDEHDEQSDN